MIEAVFSDSAGGSLKMAQAIGTSALLGITDAVTIHGGPTPEDIAEVQRHAAARQHRWASAVPLGGTPGDVFAFGLGLSTPLSDVDPSVCPFHQRYCGVLSK